MSLQQLAILSSIALMVESTEASPFWWPEIIKKRAAAASEQEDEPGKKVSKAAVDDDNKFSNKPTTKTAETSKKPATSAKPKPTSAKPSAKPSSAVPSPSAAISSSAISSSPSPTSIVPPLMVTNTPSSTSASIAPSTTPKSVAEADSQGGVSGGAIGGIIAAIVIIILGAVAYFVVRRKKQQQQQRNRRMSNKPDPFTMGYGSDQAFHSQPPPQMQQTYQHQYGIQPSIAVTSPTSPTSPYYNNQPFSDANNHIIAESMIPAVVPKHDTAYQPDVYQQQQQEQEQQYGDQQYQSQLQPQPQQQQYQQPQPMYQSQEPPQQQPMSPTTAIDSNNTLVGAPAMMAVAATGLTASSAGTIQQSNKLLAPTQPGSVGVFHVAATYTPTLSDEIDIQTGDQVEVLVEYDDGWCQGINLTRGNAKGVFPKHCIDYSSGAAASVISGGGNSEVDRVKRVSSMYIA